MASAIRFMEIAIEARYSSEVRSSTCACGSRLARISPIGVMPASSMLSRATTNAAQAPARWTAAGVSLAGLEVQVPEHRAVGELGARRRLIGGRAQLEPGD